MILIITQSSSVSHYFLPLTPKHPSLQHALNTTILKYPILLGCDAA